MPTQNFSGARRRDAVVVGGRCAGSATAMLLAQRGYDVLLVDRATFPSDTLSTHAIARSGVVQLHTWGLLDRLLDAGTPPLRSVAFHGDNGSIEMEVKMRHGVDAIVAPRRTVLDAMLLDEARRSGVEVVTGVTATGVTRDDAGRVTGVTLRDHDDLAVDARIVIGADGLKSRIARSVGSPIIRSRPATGALHYGYFEGDWGPLEYFPGHRSFGGIFPTNDGEACVWVSTPASDAVEVRRDSDTLDEAFDRMLAGLQGDIRDRVGGTPPSGPIRGVMNLPNQFRQAHGSGWALVGDAGYHRDAITGHGISDAFRDAALLADWLDRAWKGTIDESKALAAYQAERDEMSAELFAVNEAMLRYPEGVELMETQKKLSSAMERHAARVSARFDSGRIAA